MAELESHEKGLLPDASTLASPEFRSVRHYLFEHPTNAIQLANAEEGKEIEFNVVRRPRKSTASDDSSVHSEKSHGKKKAKLTAGEERTQIIMSVFPTILSLTSGAGEPLRKRKKRRQS